MGRCCENDNIGAECLEGTNLWDSLNNKLSLQHQKSTDYVSRQNAIQNCPQKYETCGTKKNPVASYTSEEKAISFVNNLALNEQCSWSLIAQCGGTPGWVVDNTVTTIDDDDVYFHYVEYYKSHAGIKIDQYDPSKLARE